MDKGSSAYLREKQRQCKEKQESSRNPNDWKQTAYFRRKAEQAEREGR